MDKQLGSLIGLHVGDSLGSTLEFFQPKNITKKHIDIIGGGVHSWKAGEPTDDTQMMLMVLESLTEFKTVNIEDISNRFINWFDSAPKDVGMTVAKGIKNLKSGISPFRSGLRDEMSQGNGSLMRCAPLALFELEDFFIKQQCSITHAHENCVLADLIFIKALKMCFDGCSKSDIYQVSLNTIPKDKKYFYEYLKEIPNMPWDKLPTNGYVIHTLGAAFWGLLNTESFEEALIEVVNRGNDADTCGAVTGALCGAYYGVNSIPKRWLDTILEGQKIDILVKKLVKKNK